MKKSVWLIPVMLGAMALLVTPSLSSKKMEMAFDTGPEPMSMRQLVGFSTGPEPLSIQSAIFSTGPGPLSFNPGPGPMEVASFDPGPGPMWNLVNQSENMES